MLDTHDLEKAIDEATEAGATQLRKSQMAFDFTAPPEPAPVLPPHHKAYTRRNKSGTTSLIKQKGHSEEKHVAEKYRNGGSDLYVARKGGKYLTLRGNQTGHTANISMAAMFDNKEDAVKAGDRHDERKREAKSNKPTTRFKGDKAEYTGKSEMIAGGTFYEVKLLEGHEKGQTKLVSKAPEQTDEQAGAKLAEEMSTLGQKHIGDPKGLINAIVAREFGKLEFINGAGQKEPLKLKIRHDQNMVTVGYEHHYAGRGVATSIGGEPTMTGLTIQRQDAYFNSIAKGLEREIKNCGIKVEDSSVEKGTLFFVSDDMIPKKTQPKSAKEALEDAGLKHTLGEGYKPELDPYQNHQGSVPHNKVHKHLTDAGYKYTEKGIDSGTGQDWHSYERSVPYATDRITIYGNSKAITRATRYSGPARD